MIESMRFALRQMRKNPGFAALAITTLALGIGANTAMFTVIDSVMLRALPYPEARQIVAITTGPASDGNAVASTSWLNYADLHQQARQFQSVAAYAVDFAVIRTTDVSDGVNTVRGSASMFDVLGVHPQIGRAFLDSDNQPGAPNVVILTAGLWHEHFASDRQVIGRQVRVGDDPYTVVGVLPDGLRFAGSGASKGIWIPYRPDQSALKDRNSNFLFLLGRLRPGVGPKAVQSEVDSIARGIVEKDPENAKNLAFRVIPFSDSVTGSVRPVFLALTGALLLVLLIACANVANLQLARCLARTQELAVRTALGAGRGALLTQMLVEGAMLCIPGALVGLGLSQLALMGIHRLPPDLIPRGEEIHLRWTVFLMLVVTSAIVTLLSSIVPAVVAMLSDPQAVLQEGSRGSSASLGYSRLSGLLVAGEVALSVILLVAGGLMFRTLYNLQHVSVGFEEADLTSFIALPGSAAGFFSMKEAQSSKQEDSIALRVYAPMQEKLRHLPGVVDAAFANVVPFLNIEMRSSFRVLGRPTSVEEMNKSQAFMRAVSGTYARTMGIRVLRGRAITDDDSVSSPYSVTINEALSRLYFPGEDPIGRQIDFAKDEKDRLENGMLKPYTIVGVMADSMQGRIKESAEPEIQLPYAQIPVRSFYYQILVLSETTYVVKTHGPVAIASAIRNAFHESAPDFAVDDFTTMHEAHDSADFNQRLGLYLIASFAGIAVVMVLAGLYGVLSQLVGQRRREIGIRMALGADRPAILALILRRGFILVGVGLIVGLFASLAAERSVKSFLYGVSPVDGLTYAGVVLVLLLAGGAAALVPARRAASTEPTQALRAD